jgi:hypothetical protein
MKNKANTLTKDMSEDDWSSLHDAVYCALYVLGQAPIGRHLDRETLTEVLQRLPEHTLGAALSWGFGDTVVRDNIVRFVRDGVQRMGSLEAFLEANPSK